MRSPLAQTRPQQLSAMPHLAPRPLINHTPAAMAGSAFSPQLFPSKTQRISRWPHAAMFAWRSLISRPRNTRIDAVQAVPHTSFEVLLSEKDMVEERQMKMWAKRTDRSHRD